jgi:hypothetical protein
MILDRIMISSPDLSMICLENQYPLFRIMLWLRLALHRTPEKGRKDCPATANIPVKGG